ncbi:MAG: hypothetical protein KDI90_09545 [Alphaproteobacteria bacterium]|nr:hypothetical protein [Alphaproteobacteria bacterium]MCB9975958.1 hypothetical protein [Rhodospirillales bacterium]
MSNFTKSVIYSTAVLAVGLVGIMAISSQRDGQAGVASLEPAAGESDMGIDFSKLAEDGAEQAGIEPAAGNAGNAAQSEMDEALQAVEGELVDQSDSVSEDLSSTGSSDAPSPEEGIEAELSETSDSGESADDVKSIQAIEDALSEKVEAAKEIEPAAGANDASDIVEKIKEQATDEADDTARELGLEE